MACENKLNCQYCDESGFCAKYSNLDVVWKCKGDADCEGYTEVDHEEKV